jgi:hypothetical protein
VHQPDSPYGKKAAMSFPWQNAARAAKLPAHRQRRHRYCGSDQFQRQRGIAQRVVRTDYDKPGMVANCFSSGNATEVAMVSGLAPGKFAPR